MASNEETLKDYTDTKIDSSLTKNTSLLNDYNEVQDNLEFQDNVEAVRSDTVQYNGAQLKKKFYLDTTQGIWFGIDSDGIAKINIGNGTNSIKWDGTALTIVGALTATSGTIGGFNIGADYIRDVANSFGLASTVTGSDDVRFWAGDTFANRATALAAIFESGLAVFKSIRVGGASLQYQVTNQGIFSFGDGVDGNVTISADTTLTSDKYYENLTIDSGKTLNTGGYRVFVKNTLTLNGLITRNGNNGGNGGNGGSPDVNGNNRDGGSGGSAGAALADGYLKGSVAGKIGSVGGVGGDTNTNDAGTGTAGVVGADTLNSIGSNGVTGGTGAIGGNGRNDGNTVGLPGKNGGLGGAIGTATVSNVRLIANWHLATLLDIASSGSTVKFDNSAGSGSGGGGGGGGGTQQVAFDRGFGGGGGGGGGSGSSGGIVAIYAKTIIISATGVLRANGGAGGNGGNGGVGSAEGTGNGGGGAGGGGGGGGNGGQIIIVYNSLTNSGTIEAAGGTGGTGGTGGASGGSPATSGGNGSSGTTGGAGTIRYFELSL